MCMGFKKINVIDTVEDSYVSPAIFFLLKENCCHKCMNINALFTYFTFATYFSLQLQATDMLFSSGFFF